MWPRIISNIRQAQATSSNRNLVEPVPRFLIFWNVSTLGLARKTYHFRQERQRPIPQISALRVVTMFEKLFKRACSALLNELLFLSAKCLLEKLKVLSLVVWNNRRPISFRYCSRFCTISQKIHIATGRKSIYSAQPVVKKSTTAFSLWQQSDCSCIVSTGQRRLQNVFKSNVHINIFVWPMESWCFWN